MTGLRRLPLRVVGDVGQKLVPFEAVNSADAYRCWHGNILFFRHAAVALLSLAVTVHRCAHNH
jgi:hypothetical protein